MGATLALPYALSNSKDAWLSECKAQDIKTVALAADPDADALWALPARHKTALILGNEGHGIEAKLLCQLDATATIPVSSSVDSLNVAQAASVALYELTRTRLSDQTQQC